MKKLLLKMLPIFIFSFGFGAHKSIRQLAHKDKPKSWRCLRGLDNRIQPFVGQRSHATCWGKPGGKEKGVVVQSFYRIDSNALYCIHEVATDWGWKGRQRNHIVQKASKENDTYMINECEKVAQALAVEDQKKADENNLD